MVLSPLVLRPLSPIIVMPLARQICDDRLPIDREAAKSDDTACEKLTQ